MPRHVMSLPNTAAHDAISVERGNAPLVLDSPHSGTAYPPDFDYGCNFAALRQAEDTHVEKLYSFAPALGCAWIEAHFPRSYLDANRNITEVDPTMLDASWPHAVDYDSPAIASKRRLGKGLIWKLTDEGLPIYDRKLSVAEVESRIANCWQPYHAAMAAAVDAAHARHGYSIHLNCHSMPGVASSHATDFPGERHADFVLGNRDLYMEHATLEMHETRFGRLQQHLIGLVERLLKTDPRKLWSPRRGYSSPRSFKSFRRSFSQAFTKVSSFMRATSDSMYSA